jgi:hypothetical protein
MLFGALDETVTSWLLSEKAYPLKERAAPLVDLFLRGAAVAIPATGVRPVRTAASGRRAASGDLRTVSKGDEHGH